ncbi:MAG: penicillin-binding transpeptidase domain-containing protein [Candidatus Acidiferrum sp.]
MPENRDYDLAGGRTHGAATGATAGRNSGGNPASRLLIVAGLALLWMAGVGGRLAYLQLIRHSDYMARAMRQQQRTIEISPKRGEIYDRNMHPLAMSIQVDSAFAVPSEIADVSLAARLLAGVLGVPRNVLEERLGTSNSFVWVQRKLPPEQAEALGALNLKGIYLQKENQRFYPKRDLAAHVLGFVDPDEKGLGGIESELDGQIRGKSERVMVMADARQHHFDSALMEGAAQRDRGASVVLTLDEKIQYIAERELAAAIGKTHAPAGTVIVMNPNNGEILALANWPKFNPNTATAVPAEARMNRAVSAIYEPGSTFKLITLAAAFDQGITRPEEVFDCENGSVVVAGHRIHDHKPFGLLTVSEVLAKSSDVGAIKVAMRLGAPQFYEYIRAFGFGMPTGVDMPGESRGLLHRLEHWTPISIGAVSMGQEVGVTPIQLIAAVSAIANGGTWYRPHVVAELRRGEQVLPGEGPLAAAEPKSVIHPQTAATLRRLMEGVLLKGGTGTLARLDGWTAAGKTGTAQKIDPNTGRYSRTDLIASFTGFAPINDPAVTILVSLDSPVGPHEGGMVAAPVFKRVAEQVLAYLDVPRDVPVSARLVQAAYENPDASEESSLEDFTPTDFSAVPDDAQADAMGTKNAIARTIPGAKTGAATTGAGIAMKSRKVTELPPAVTVSVDGGGDITVPDFGGETMRDVSEQCLRLGLNPVLVGTSLATGQTPAAGAKVKHGAKVTVEFGTPEANSDKPARTKK